MNTKRLWDWYTSLIHFLMLYLFQRKIPFQSGPLTAEDPQIFWVIIHQTIPESTINVMLIKPADRISIFSELTNRDKGEAIEVG